MGTSPKVYVTVLASFDENGNITPRRLFWEDGCAYPIDRVLDVTPAPALKAGGAGDRYTIMVKGARRYLFFERNDERDTANVGRWFLERRAQ